MNKVSMMRFKRWPALFCITFTGLFFSCFSLAERILPPMPPMDTSPKPPSTPTISKELKGRTGLITKEDGVSDGYVLIATKEHPSFYLIDNDGYIVHEWNQPRKTSLSVYLLPNGNLLRTVRSLDGEVGDYIEELTWDGEMVWEYKTDRTQVRLHHDIERLPNGNTLVTAWERIEKDEYLAMGRNPDTVANDEMWVDAIYEVKPTGRSTGEIVWRWSAWDHLIQNFDPAARNFGNPADHPECIDLNEVRKGRQFPKLSDWLHINSLAYNADRDEIVLSSHALSELWVVSKKTGDIVYRWGNPRLYGRGEPKDRRLFGQHDIHWIPNGLRGAGNLMVFNNDAGLGKMDGKYSAVLEIEPPLTESGNWPSPTEKGYPPGKVTWEFSGHDDNKFYSMVVSSAQRLKNGNTLICVGARGMIIEVDPDENLVWNYVNPVFREGPPMKKLEQWNPAPPPGGNLLFRAYRYLPDYPAFEGKDLSPGRLLKDVADEKQNSEPVE